jgi:hypothetical protein
MNQGFSYYLCLMMEGSGSGPLTNRSGSGRPKNIRIWIRNTARNLHTFGSTVIQTKHKYSRLILNCIIVQALRCKSSKGQQNVV